MKHCIELSSDEDVQLSDYIHARYGARSHGKVSVVLREALREYLSNHAIVQSILQKSTADARIDKPGKEIALPKERAENEVSVPAPPKVALEKKSETRKLRRSIKKDPVAMEKLKQMYESGARQIDIADALGYNRKTMHGVIKVLEESGVLKKIDRSH